MNKKKLILTTIAIIIIGLLTFMVMLGTASQNYYQEAERVEHFENIHATYGITRSWMNTETRTYPFLLHRAGSVSFVLWSKSLTGSARLSILDAHNQVVHHWQGRAMDVAEEIQLQPGAYTIELVLTRYAGSLKFGLNGVQFLIDLPADRYQRVKANPSAGFSWDYLLYTPETVQEPYLLVAPNNTGYEDDNMRFHEESAKNLAQNLSELADQLGTPLLVPIFPRPAGELAVYYTHNLDRNALLMDLEGYQRLDLQLLAMVDDARALLAKDQIRVEPRFLMWGYSASGAFTDRFSLLHPDRLVAVAAGGCNHSLPFATFRGENLPYPVGTFDYAVTFGAPFNAEAFAGLPRFLYKGDQDSGGTMTTDEGVFPADEYFDRFVRHGLEDRLKVSSFPLIAGPDMSQAEEDLLRYHVYQGAVFVDEFRAVSEIYAKAGLENSHFKLYPGVGHEITAEMRADVLAFFQNQLR